MQVLRKFQWYEVDHVIRRGEYFGQISLDQDHSGKELSYLETAITSEKEKVGLLVLSRRDYNRVLLKSHQKRIKKKIDFFNTNPFF